MAAALDVELKRAFQELQEKMVDTRQKLKMASYQVDSQRQIIRRADLTSSTVRELTEDTVTYKSVGRMFVKQSVKESLDVLEDQKKEAKSKISTFESNKARLEQSLKESEDNIREMISARQANR